MIKHFLKVFFLTVATFTTVIIISSLIYMFFVDKNMTIGTVRGVKSDSVFNIDNDKSKTPFEKAMAKSSRINVLVVGLENKRTDTIMVVSYDKKTKDANIISIPRDTYYPRKGYEKADTKKINAVYGTEGIDGLMDAVRKILGIQLEKYVIFDYSGVVKCVDAMGGVEVDVPIDMKYDDPYDTPPLHINIKAGVQVLDGQKSLEYLRFRKGYDNQDLGRIEAQQRFVKSALKKAISFKLPVVIKEAYSSVKTNFSLTELLGLAGSAVGFSPDSINGCTLPGKDTPLEGLSFFVCDEEGIRKLVYGMYYFLDENVQNTDVKTQ